MAAVLEMASMNQAGLSTCCRQKTCIPGSFPNGVQHVNRPTTGTGRTQQMKAARRIDEQRIKILERES